VITSSGDYAVSLNKHGCVDTSDCYTVIPSGVKMPGSESDKLSVYPNPNAGFFTIEHTFSKGRPFTVTNINGKVIHRGTLTQEQTKVDLSELATGMYLLRVEHEVVKLIVK
jgi:hypothetical protein